MNNYEGGTCNTNNANPFYKLQSVLFACIFIKNLERYVKVKKNIFSYINTG